MINFVTRHFTSLWAFITSVDRESAASLGLPLEAVRDGFRLQVKNTAEATALILKHPEIFSDFEITKGKMDDVFLAVTGKKLEGGEKK